MSAGDVLLGIRPGPGLVEGAINARFLYLLLTVFFGTVDHSLEICVFRVARRSHTTTNGIPEPVPSVTQRDCVEGHVCWSFFFSLVGGPLQN